MSSSRPDDADNSKPEQPQRRKRSIIAPLIMVAFIGVYSFLSVVFNPRFQTFHVLDVVRLMTAGAAIGVAYVLLLNFFNSPKPRSEDQQE